MQMQLLWQGLRNLKNMSIATKAIHGGVSKEKGYGSLSMPIYQTSFENVHQGVARFRRVIGAADADLGER